MMRREPSLQELAIVGENGAVQESSRFYPAIPEWNVPLVENNPGGIADPNELKSPNPPTPRSLAFDP